MIFAGTNITESLVKRAPPWRILWAPSLGLGRDPFMVPEFLQKTVPSEGVPNVLVLDCSIAVQEHTSHPNGKRKSLKYSSLSNTHKAPAAASGLQSMDLNTRDTREVDCISFATTDPKCNSFPLSTLEIWTLSQTKKKISDRGRKGSSAALIIAYPNNNLRMFAVEDAMEPVSELGGCTAAVGPTLGRWKILSRANTVTTSSDSSLILSLRKEMMLTAFFATLNFLKAAKNNCGFST
jgi:hypothetical protein